MVTIVMHFWNMGINLFNSNHIMLLSILTLVTFLSSGPDVRVRHWRDPRVHAAHPAAGSPDEQEDRWPEAWRHTLVGQTWLQDPGDHLISDF